MAAVTSRVCVHCAGITRYCEQHKWDSLKGCALFSIVGSTGPDLALAFENRLESRGYMVLNPCGVRPKMATPVVKPSRKCKKNSVNLCSKL